MAYSGVQIEGLRQLRSTLRAAGDDLSKLKAINAAAASIAASRAQSWAPRGATGNLAASVRSSGTKTAGIIRAGNNRRSASGVPYANPIHWGWKARNIKANPFLSYSAQATESKWVGLYFEYVKETLDDIKGI